ncbi:MAG: hypothetical protein NUV91_04655 [Candidatus Omnitrophica bacterium]|nr:hypothetical protein [Candidatus Omnitrophota bacterium]
MKKRQLLFLVLTIFLINTSQVFAGAVERKSKTNPKGFSWGVSQEGTNPLGVKSDTVLKTNHKAVNTDNIAEKDPHEFSGEKSQKLNNKSHPKSEKAKKHVKDQSKHSHK